MFEELVSYEPDEKTLWNGEYKIPWNERAFSERMLQEHLTQEHDLASRKTETIDAHVQWLHDTLFQGKTSRILDLGCGPGLYLSRLEALGYEGIGIDFSPASVDYAKQHCSKIELGDVREVDFGKGFDAAMMLYSELNVFSPKDCKKILSKVHEALQPGGTLVLEMSLFETVKEAGVAPSSWYRSTAGGLQALFSDKPHVTLLENRWFENEQVALTDFWVMEETGAPSHYRSTMQGYTEEETRTLLQECGFNEVTFHGDFGKEPTVFQVITALKA